MVYFAENMIVTHEEKPSKSGPQGAVRVYSNWEHDLSQPMKPMRARIAGMEPVFLKIPLRDIIGTLHIGNTKTSY